MAWVRTGTPAATVSSRRRHNHYCVDCARSELFGDRAGAPSLDDVSVEAGEAADFGLADEGPETDAPDERSPADAADADATGPEATDSVREATDSTE